MPDMEKVINEYEDYVNSYISLTTSHDYEFEMHKAVLAVLKKQEDTINELQNAYSYLQKQFFEAQDKLLEEQEEVEPKVSCSEQRCGNCNKVIEMDGWVACPWCGKPIAWERWWRKNGTRN